MAQEIKQANIFGRVGSGIGKGLAEQVPKEIERHRLATGLQNLEKEGSNLSPFQQFSRLSSIPGITPQMIESGSKLLRQQGINQALMNKSSQENMPKSNPFQKERSELEISNESPSLTTRTPIEATLNPYIPKSFDQLQERAGQLLEKNPALYAQDPDKAMQAAVQEDQSEQSISSALQGQRQKQQDVQNKVVEGLQDQKQQLALKKVPGNVYSEIEDKAINSVKSKQEGGEGLTEQQAKKKYGDELREIDRQYTTLQSIGNWSMLGRSGEDNKRSLKSARDDFKERNDLQNFADTLIGENGLSPQKAYYLSYPSSEIKELNNSIVKAPELKNLDQTFSSYRDIDNKTLELAKKLAPLMGKNGSPLSIAEEINAKGYNPDVWLDYVNKNKKALDLTTRQAEELTKPKNRFPTLNDNWLFTLSGLDKLVEQ